MARCVPPRTAAPPATATSWCGAAGALRAAAALPACWAGPRRRHCRCCWAAAHPAAAAAPAAERSGQVQDRRRDKPRPVRHHILQVLAAVHHQGQGSASRGQRGRRPGWRRPAPSHAAAAAAAAASRRSMGAPCGLLGAPVRRCCRADRPLPAYCLPLPQNNAAACVHKCVLKACKAPTPVCHISAAGVASCGATRRLSRKLA